jgi:single-strand DNA-binding protein
MSLANISIVGNLVKAPEQMCFPSGKTKSTFTVAVNRPHRTNSNNANAKGDGADYYRVETWGKLAELTSSYLQKGNQVTVIGRLTFDHWMDRQGAMRMTPIVEANHVAFPQRLKLVKDGETENAGNPISGEIVCPDELPEELMNEFNGNEETSVETNGKSSAKLKNRNTA